jgi:hypothetical protein
MGGTRIYVFVTYQITLSVSADHVASESRMNGKQRIGKNVEGSGRGNSVRLVGVQAIFGPLSTSQKQVEE